MEKEANIGQSEKVSLFRERIPEGIEIAKKTIKEALKLNDYFDFDNFQSLITGADQQEKEKSIFLINTLISVFENYKGGGKALFGEEIVNTKANYASIVKEKQLLILQTIRPVETTLCYVDSFFKNSMAPKSQFSGVLTILQGLPGDMYESKGVIKDVVQKILKKNSDVYIQTQAYGYVIVPELGKDPSLFQEWAKLTTTYRAMLITDYKNPFDCPAMNKGVFDDPVLTNLVPNPVEDTTFKGTDMERAAMIFNFLVAREPLIDGEETLAIPGSAAFCGFFASAPFADITAGFDKGKFLGVRAATHKLSKSTINMLNTCQLVPIMQQSDDQTPVAFGINNLYNGTTLYYQKLPYMKAHDWIAMNIENLLNNNTFTLLDENTKTIIKNTIQSFLNYYTGEGNIYESATVDKIITDAEEKIKKGEEGGDPFKINVYITLKPKIIAERFTISLSGKLKGENPDGEKKG